MKSIFLIVAVVSALFASSVRAQGLKILVFSKVEAGAFVHASIGDGITAIQEIGVQEGWTVDVTTNASQFNSANLAGYDVVAFNNTAGDVLNSSQQDDFEAFIRNGGGYVGIHSASATEFSWPWYEELVGAYFKSHPPRQSAVVNVEASDCPCCAHLPQPWSLFEEWYDWQSNPRDKAGMKILLTVDESTYNGGTMGADHPISWRRELDGGRTFYTALGHESATFQNADFRKYLKEGIKWVANTIVTDGLLLDLNADKEVTLEDGDQVIAWKNQVSSSVAQNFIINDLGRGSVGGPGSGRPTLRSAVPELNGHNTLVFEEDELINFEEDAFDHLTTGSGHTWIAVVAPYAQNVNGGLANVNAFFGNLRNSNLTGGRFEGFWGGFNDDSTLWSSARNSVGGSRFSLPNHPQILGPQIQSNEYRIVVGRMEAGTGTVSMELFVDNEVPIGSASFPVVAAANPSKMAIGTERDATNHPGFESFDGEIARFLIYERPLEDAELKQTLDSLKETYFGSTNSTNGGLIFDFETGDLQGATITSGSFSEIVTGLDNFHTTGAPYNKQGDFFLSTLQTINGPKSDLYTGTITSPLFVLTDPDMSLLVGGGSRASLYFGIYLEDGTEIYRTNRGVNAEPLELRTANLSAYVGQTIYWEVGDLSTTSWGYIAVDDIRFNQNPEPDPVLNLSTRGRVGTGDDVLIGGFIIQGTGTKQLLITGRGPSIPSSVPGRLADPKIDIYDVSGTVIASNDNWASGPQAAAISATSVGGPASAADAAVLLNLGPGAYTAIVRGSGATEGIGIVEIYDLAPGGTVFLKNLSTRGAVGTGDNVLICGMIVGSSTGVPAPVVIRGRGPSIPSSVPGRLTDPTVQLFNGATPVVTVDDWTSSVFANGGSHFHLQPGSPYDSAFLRSYPSGAHTAILSGSGGGTGIGIVELFIEE